MRQNNIFLMILSIVILSLLAACSTTAPPISEGVTTAKAPRHALTRNYHKPRAREHRAAAAPAQAPSATPTLPPIVVPPWNGVPVIQDEPATVDVPDNRPPVVASPPYTEPVETAKQPPTLWERFDHAFHKKLRIEGQHFKLEEGEK